MIGLPSKTPTILRLRIAGAVMGSYVLAFGWMLPFGWQGRWIANILFIGSLPLATIAIVTAFLFAESVRRRRGDWAFGGAFAAVAISVLAMLIVTRSLVGFASLAVAIPAATIFCVVMRLWRPTHDGAPADQSA